MWALYVSAIFVGDHNTVPRLPRLPSLCRLRWRYGVAPDGSDTPSTCTKTRKRIDARAETSPGTADGVTGAYQSVESRRYLQKKDPSGQAEASVCSGEDARLEPSRRA